MRSSKCLLVFGLLICCVAVAVSACRREPGKTPSDKPPQQPNTILDDLKARLMPTVAPDVNAWLGPDLFALVSEPETILSYRIVPKKSANGEQLAGYPLAERGPELSPEQRVQLQWLLLDQQSYRTESMKKCLFLPEYAFTLHKGETALTVLLATSCPQIKFLTGDKTLLRDCDPALPKFQQLLESLFPKPAAMSKIRMTPADQTPTIAPAVAEFLAGPALDAITGPEQVTAYRIFPKKQAADTTLHGYPILKQSAELTPEQIAALQAVVLAEASYRFESVKKCLFLPEYAVTAVRGDAEVTLLCDVNCGQVEFLIGDQTILKDWQNQGLESLRTLIETCFDDVVRDNDRIE